MISEKKAELIADNIEYASQIRWASDSHRADAIRCIIAGSQITDDRFLDRDKGVATSIIDNLRRAYRQLNDVAFDAITSEVQELIAERDRLLSELDPPICRLQFPDGSVPGNAREAAEGWKKWADEFERRAKLWERLHDERTANEGRMER